MFIIQIFFGKTIRVAIDDFVELDEKNSLFLELFLEVGRVQHFVAFEVLGFRLIDKAVVDFVDLLVHFLEAPLYFLFIDSFSRDLIDFHFKSKLAIVFFAKFAEFVFVS